MTYRPNQKTFNVEYVQLEHVQSGFGSVALPLPVIDHLEPSSEPDSQVSGLFQLFPVSYTFYVGDDTTLNETYKQGVYAQDDDFEAMDL